MRGITQVYGGPSDKHLHQNVVFHRHSDVSNIEELIEKLRQSDFHLSSAKINANSHTNKLICLLFSFAPQKLKDRYARYESTEKKAGAKSDDISQP